MKILLIPAVSALLMATACAQPEPPAEIAPEPVFDKWGHDGGGCTGSGTAGGAGACPPDGGDDYRIPGTTTPGGGGGGSSSSGGTAGAT